MLLAVHEKAGKVKAIEFKAEGIKFKAQSMAKPCVNEIELFLPTAMVIF